ncbi:hypothetical protein BJ917_0311 [Pseudomonas sp. WPR_5_2]|nr:hypothetical protein BJ917_0311 [Pseudomonas sp. WPR_5_2]
MSFPLIVLGWFYAIDPMPTSPYPLNSGRAEVDPMKESGMTSFRITKVSMRLMMTILGSILAGYVKKRITR